MTHALHTSQGAIVPRFDDTECLHRNILWQQECCCCGEKHHSIPSDPEEEDPSGKSGGC